MSLKKHKRNCHADCEENSSGKDEIKRSDKGIQKQLSKLM